MSTHNKKELEDLRSQRWFGPDDLRSFGHRSRTKQMGYASEEFSGKPVIGIINTWNDLSTCHTHFPERVQDVKRGILEAGGFPAELPAMSLGEQLQKPYGACVLHVAPEAALGGPLALVRDGDVIELDVAARRLDLLVDEADLAKRKAEWRPPEQRYTRGYTQLFLKHVMQADKGCDFDFLLGQPGSVPEPDIF